jgi:outer membrane protein TolC
MLRKLNIAKLLYGTACILLTTSNTNTNAQEIKKLSLEEATQLALNHDFQLKADSAQIAILNAKLMQNKKSLLPDIGLNTNYTRISDNITPFIASFPTGDVTLNPQILNQSYNSLQLKQLIWSGGKVNYGIEISEKEVDAAKFDAEKTRVNTIYNIAALWYNMYVLKNSKKIIEANINLLSQNQQDVNNFVRQGIVLENEALKIDLAITNLQSNLIDIINTINTLNFNLCLFTGLPANTAIEQIIFIEEINLSELKLETYLTTALANRAELKTLKTYNDIASIGVKIAKSNYLPTVSAIASGNYNLPEQRVFPNQDNFTGTWFVGVNVNWAISSLYKNTDKINESKQATTKTYALYNLAKEGIIIEVNTAYTEYLQAKQKIVILKKSVEQATENFRVEQNKLNASAISASDFLDANTRLLLANLNLNAANANAQLALKKLNKTIGQ